MKPLFIILLSVIYCTACMEEKKPFSAPISDLAHIDLVLDSLAFHAILQDSFLTKEFAVASQDTTLYSKPSYDIYLLGREAFLHISLASEYWENKEGSGVMIFQTRKSSKGDSLQAAWKQFYSDSLYFHTFQGGDFELEEIMPYRKKDLSKPAEPNFTPILTSYSTQSYKNWGFDDTAISKGVTSQEFMNSWDINSQIKLFKKIKTLDVQLTNQEFAEMESAVYAMGYIKQENRFSHDSNPTINFTITDTNITPKYTRIEIELAKKAPDQIITLGDTYQITVKDSSLIISKFN